MLVVEIFDLLNQLTYFIGFLDFFVLIVSL